MSHPSLQSQTYDNRPMLLSRPYFALSFSRYTRTPQWARAKFTSGYSPIHGPVPVLHPTGNSSQFSFTYDTDPEILSHEQRLVFSLALKGESVFFTGSAGTGKSFLLRKIIQSLRNAFAGDEIAVTASTGLASLNIGGRTLHSFAGVGLGKQNTSLLIAKSLHRTNLERWRKVKVLVIDEISMVDARWFDVLSEIGKIMKGNRRPFGGMQLIISGDFFQLPPVREQRHIDAGLPVRFAFQASDWDNTVPNKIRLTQVFRQRQSRLIQMLEDMRTGSLTKASEELLYSLSRSVNYSDGIKPVEIYPRRLLADGANLRQMEDLPGSSIIYRAEDRLGRDVHKKALTLERGRLLLDKSVTDTVELKVGAQVMFIKNIPAVKVMNGSLGTITNFLTPEEARNSPHFIEAIPSCDTDCDPVTYDVSNSYTSQGFLETVNNMFSERVQDEFVGVKGRYSARDPEFPWPIIQTEGRKWPLVRLQNGVELLVTPTYFTHENVVGQTEACRAQVPLALAWALTVHKAQGQTLSRVKVDLAGTFAPGQAYVAISRCTSLEGLEVTNFSPNVVFAHPQVVEWDKTLAVASQLQERNLPHLRKPGVTFR